MRAYALKVLNNDKKDNSLTYAIYFEKIYEHSIRPHKLIRHIYFFQKHVHHKKNNTMSSQVNMCHIPNQNVEYMAFSECNRGT